MNKVKILLVLLLVALLCIACTTEPDPTVEPTGSSEQLQATEASLPVENLPGVEENVFDESEIEIPTDPVNVDTGDGGVTNTGSSNQGGTGNQGGSNNQGSSNNQGGSNNQGSTGNQGGSNNQGSTGNQGSSNNQGSTGNQGGSNNQGGSEQPTEPGNESDTDSFYVSYEEYNAMTPEEQVEYFNKFPSMEAFVKWYNEAKAEYEEENGAIEIGGDGSVDLGDIVNP